LLRSTAFLGGKWIAADGGASIAVRDPADGSPLAEVADCGAAETRRAIAAAEAALPAWRGQTAKQRAQLLQRWFSLINQNADDLAQLITAEGGKPLAEARGEVAYGASFVEWFAEEGKRTYGETIPATAPTSAWSSSSRPSASARRSRHGTSRSR
jgi:succinate-semialdehyde dehydrogenase/glutarate-semialdehyde dehydrogenase